MIPNSEGTMSYVETGLPIAINRIPSVVADMHRAHRERQERIKAAAYATKVKEAAEVDDQQVALLEVAIEAQPTWEERQKAIPIQKAHWFSIVAEIKPPPVYPLVETIQRVTCKYFQISRNDLLAPRRDKRVAYPRQVAMYLTKTLTIKSLPEIGRRFNRTDHTTPRHAFLKIQRLIKEDWTVAYDVAHVEMML